MSTAKSHSFPINQHWATWNNIPYAYKYTLELSIVRGSYTVPCIPHFRFRKIIVCGQISYIKNIVLSQPLIARNFEIWKIWQLICNLGPSGLKKMHRPWYLWCGTYIFGMTNMTFSNMATGDILIIAIFPRTHNVFTILMSNIRFFWVKEINNINVHNKPATTKQNGRYGGRHFPMWLPAIF